MLRSDPNGCWHLNAELECSSSESQSPGRGGFGLSSLFGRRDQLNVDQVDGLWRGRAVEGSGRGVCSGGRWRWRRRHRMRRRVLEPACLVANRLVDLSGDPQSVEQYGELAGHGNLGALLRVLATSLGEFESPTAQVAVLPERSQDVVRAQHQQTPHERIARLRDPQLRVVVSGFLLPWPQPQEGAGHSAVGEAVLVLQREHEY